MKHSTNANWSRMLTFLCNQNIICYLNWKIKSPTFRPGSILDLYMKDESGWLPQTDLYYRRWHANLSEKFYKMRLKMETTNRVVPLSFRPPHWFLLFFCYGPNWESQIFSPFLHFHIENIEKHFFSFFYPCLLRFAHWFFWILFHSIRGDTRESGRYEPPQQLHEL